MNTNRNDLHVVFGSGPVGRAVIDTLLAQNQRVRLVKRSGTADVPAAVEVVQGDASNAESTRAVCQGATVVYNCTNPKDYHRWHIDLPPLHYGIVEGTAASGAKLVVMDNLYMYGPTDGQPITEQTPYNGRGARGTTRIRVARYLEEVQRSGRARVVVGRASDFFGPRVTNALMGEDVFRAALQGKTAQLIGRPDMPHTYSYMPDIGRALVLLGQRDEALGEVWHISSPETVTTGDFARLIYAEVGQPPKFKVPPIWALRAMELFVPPLRGLSENYYQFCEPYIMDHSKFEQRFDFHATPLREAIRETLDWVQAHPPDSR